MGIGSENRGIYRRDQGIDDSGEEFGAKLAASRCGRLDSDSEARRFRLPFATMRLTPPERLRLADAIADAERGSAGEIRLHLEERCPGDDALARARQLFGELGLHKTREGTGVLLYVAERDRKTAVYAGPGIHKRVAETFWSGVAREVARGFGSGRPLDGLAAALAHIGDTLRTHCPGTDVHANEIPNDVSGS